jgi:hypothetical protein
MGLRQCNECEEMVDEARAFCQACGSPLVAEAQRRESSPFERTSETVQFDSSMFNAILTDMGLDLSAPPNPRNEIGETVTPLIRTETPTTAQPRPLVQTVVPSPQNKLGKADAPANTTLKWLVWAALGFVLVFLVGLVIAALIFILWLRPA